MPNKSFRKLALCSVAAAPLYIGLAAAPAHAQLVNTATVTGTPDSGVLPPVEAMESVSVALPIDAVNDTVSGIDGSLGAAAVLNVLTDDTLDGMGVTTAEVTITEVTPATPINVGDPVPVLNPATGDIDVPAGTPAGTYTIDYQICETSNPNNCDTATATVTVEGGEILADPDEVTGINGTTGQDDVLDVLDGDTLSGAPATLADVDISVLTPATPNNPGDPVPVLDPATGTVDVPPGTPAGTYTIAYQICEELNPANCSDNIATITVDPAPILADDDSATGIDGATGATGVVDVIDGDFLNGVQTTLDDVDITVLTPAAPIIPGTPVPVLDPATGLVDVPAGTPAGDYTITYEICEELNPSNCSEATVTITVDPSPILATNDTVTGVDGDNGATDVLNVFDGDTVNGDPATTANATVSVATGSAVPPELTFDPTDGSIDVLPGTLAGDYSFDYEICEILNPDNCTTATATVTVDAAPSLIMEKTADDTEFVTVGQVITYTYEVTNNGNVIIRGVSVGDTHNGAGAAPTPTNPQLVTDNGTQNDSSDTPGDDDWDVLAPGDVIRFTGTYTVQQADIDNLQ